MNKRENVDVQPRPDTNLVLFHILLEILRGWTWEYCYSLSKTYILSSHSGKYSALVCKQQFTSGSIYFV